MTDQTHKTTNKVAYKNSVPATPLRFLWYSIVPYKFACLFMFLFTVAVTAFGVSTRYIIKIVIDSAERGETSTVIFWLMAFPVAILIIQLSWRLNAVVGGLTDIRIIKNVYTRINEYILAHSHNFYANRFTGSILNKINNIANATEVLLAEIWWTYTTFVVTIATSFVLMFTVSAYIAGALLLMVGVLMVMDWFLAKFKRRASKEYAAASTKMKGYLSDVIGNVSAVRQFSRVENEKVALESHLLTYRQKAIRSWLATEQMLAPNAVVVFLFGLWMFWHLGSLWQAGEVTTGDFALIIGVMSGIYRELMQIGKIFNSTAKALGEISEGLDDLIVPHEIVDQTNARPVTVGKGEIDWNDVNFSYGESATFDNFNLKITAGQRVGLVGPSGAGKTTFVSLLLRQHDIQSGAIMIDGQNIAEVTQDSLRENIAVVPQEPLLFHRTIRENIAYGNPDASDEDIIAVAKKAQAHDFIANLSEGYDTLVGERGVKLSGGQKQRVAIARAMLKDAPILVLDEATSALDSESEVEIQKALHILMEGKTVVAIAHRLSTLREMDRIIVMENGRIVEDGTHDALVNYGGVYARLWEHQAGGFLTE